MKARVVRFHATGGPEVLQIDTLDLPAPGAGEVQLRIQAIGLNRAEAAFRQGLYLEAPHLPARIGYEASGIVEALGTGVTGFSVGQAASVIPAFSMNKYGTNADRALLPASALVANPPGLDAQTAAASWMQYLTAYGALVEAGKLSRGQAVLITAASSSVGLAAIQIANLLGAIPIAVTRTAAKAQSLKAAGAAHVIVSETSDVVAETLRVTDNRGANLAFDPIAGPYAQTLAAALAPGGMLILYGNLSGQAMQTPFPFVLAATKALSLRGYILFEITHDPVKLERAKQFVLGGLRDGRLVPRIARVFGFEQIVEAHRYLESNQQIGKILVTIGS